MWQPLLVEEPPIHVHSAHPYLRDLFEILLLAPDMQQGLSICIGLKERCIIRPFLYLSGMDPW
jgi:hypothetical protein